MRRYSGLLLLLMLLTFGLTACDDQPATPEDEIDPPEIPPLEGMQYDFGPLGDIEPSGENIPQTEYNEVEEPDVLMQAILADMIYHIEGEILPSLRSVLEPARDIEGEFDRDAFAWEYDLETGFYDGVEIDNPAMLRAQVRGDGGVNWSLLIFGDNTEEGEFELVDGSTSQEHDQIRWTLHDLSADPIELQAAEIQWTAIDDFISNIEVRHGYEPDAPLPRNNTTYSVEEGEVTLMFNRLIDEETTQNLNAVLDYESGEGEMTYRFGGEDEIKEYCWDADFDLVDCEDD